MTDERKTVRLPLVWKEEQEGVGLYLGSIRLGSVLRSARPNFWFGMSMVLDLSFEADTEAEARAALGNARAAGLVP